MLTRPVLALLLASCASLATTACGGSGDASVFNQPAAEAGAPIQTDSGTTLGTGDDESNDGPCSPAPLAASFAPVWKAPIASASGVCTASQIQGFYDACLGAGVTAAECTNFTGSNSSCASCLQSNDTDAKYGAVIWHDNRSYYTINLAGCIADEQKDMSSTGCAAAYQAVLQCKEAACTQCYDPSTGDFTRFAACEGNADSECSKYQAAEATACGGDLADASSPASACEPGPGANGEDAYLLVAPVLCGN
jgi:hypothetical protein